MGYIISDNYVICFILSTIIMRYFSALYGPIMTWSSKASPWRVRQPLRATRGRDGMRRGNERLVPERTEGHGPSRTMFKSRLVYGSGVFLEKKGSELSGTVERPRELPEPTARKFWIWLLAYFRWIPANGNRGFTWTNPIATQRAPRLDPARESVALPNPPLCRKMRECNTPGVMVTKTGHVIICIAKHSCFSQLWCASTKTNLYS
jgi:hypothetical protein